VRSEDADSLRMLSDQLEEQGNDTGAALLRDIADRMESATGPLLLRWPKELGIGELLVRHVEVQPEHGSSLYRILINTEPTGTWTLYATDRPSGRVKYIR
jgi:hypothetical protein